MPGSTHLPDASMRSTESGSGTAPGAAMAAIFSPAMSTSAGWVPAPDTTVPPATTRSIVGEPMGTSEAAAN